MIFRALTKAFFPATPKAQSIKVNIIELIDIIESNKFLYLKITAKEKKKTNNRLKEKANKCHV